MLLRWGQLNGTELGRQGEVGEGTSIDFEEPVVITIQCDGDGWVMQVTIILVANIFKIQICDDDHLQLHWQ